MSTEKGPYGTVYDDVPHKMPTFCLLCDEGDGQLCVQWIVGKKRLTLYIEDAALDWLKSWGADIGSEMEDREDNPTTFADAYRWLMTP